MIITKINHNKIKNIRFFLFRKDYYKWNKTEPKIKNKIIFDSKKITHKDRMELINLCLYGFLSVFGAMLFTKMLSRTLNLLNTTKNEILLTIYSIGLLYCSLKFFEWSLEHFTEETKMTSSQTK